MTEIEMLSRELGEIKERDKGNRDASPGEDPEPGVHRVETVPAEQSHWLSRESRVSRETRI